MGAEGVVDGVESMGESRSHPRETGSRGVLVQDS